MATVEGGMSRKWLLVEFTGLFVVAPLSMALFLPPSSLFPALFAVTALGLVLLAITPGFQWKDLTRGAGRIGWRFVGLFTLATTLIGYAVLAVTEPAAFLLLPREMPLLMAMIVALYPILSALPQEVVFRPLFFRRYGTLLPADPRLQVGLNATVFSFAHLMYWNWTVIIMTFAGGLVFAWSYRIRGNFPEAVVLHSLAGIVVFTLGLGIFFYSGNIQRPF